MNEEMRTKRNPVKQGPCKITFPNIKKERKEGILWKDALRDRVVSCPGTSTAPCETAARNNTVINDEIAFDGSLMCQQLGEGVTGERSNTEEVDAARREAIARTKDEDPDDISLEDLEDILRHIRCMCIICGIDFMGLVRKVQCSANSSTSGAGTSKKRSSSSLSNESLITKPLKKRKTNIASSSSASGGERRVDVAVQTSPGAQRGGWRHRGVRVIVAEKGEDDPWQGAEQRRHTRPGPGLTKLANGVLVDKKAYKEVSELRENKSAYVVAARLLRAVLSPTYVSRAGPSFPETADIDTDILDAVYKFSAKSRGFKKNGRDAKNFVRGALHQVTGRKAYHLFNKQKR